jgi:hypothetical protein
MRVEPRTSLSAFRSASFVAPRDSSRLPVAPAALSASARNVLVAELLRDLERPVEDAVQVGGDDRVGGRARDLRPFVEVGLDFPRERVRIDPELLEYRDDDALSLPEHREQQVVGRELGVAARPRVGLRFLDRLLGLDRELIEPHGGFTPDVWSSTSGSRRRATRNPFARRRQESQAPHGCPVGVGS